MAAAALAAAFDRGALGVAAELLGLTDRLIEMAAQYACQREQFGRPIGTNQAVKHLLADAVLGLEFARPAVYRAAWSTAHAVPERSRDVSMAKAYASQASARAARVALQVHGAIGYTWEHDLHLWMKRAWVLAGVWGDAAWHRRRVGAAVLGPADRG
jgi:alkylation response protein AidB-like acyl-CoA dehydrogenase